MSNAPATSGLLVEAVMTNRCNRRCPYCKLDFQDRDLDDAALAALAKIVRSGAGKTRTLVNFFGGEPLLRSGKILEFLEETRDAAYAKAINTNGLLLEKDFFLRTSRAGVEYSVSLDAWAWKSSLKPFLGESPANVACNVIVHPDRTQAAGEILRAAYGLGLRRFNLMPVLATASWDAASLAGLSKAVRDAQTSYGADCELRRFAYYNGTGADRQYVLDADGRLYADLDSLLWLQRQYPETPRDLADEILRATDAGRAADAPDARALVDAHPTAAVLRLALEIPKRQGKLREYALVESVMKNPAA